LAQYTTPGGKRKRPDFTGRFFIEPPRRHTDPYLILELFGNFSFRTTSFKKPHFCRAGFEKALARKNARLGENQQGS
jgi:hypothetical protein